MTASTRKKRGFSLFLSLSLIFGCASPTKLSLAASCREKDAAARVREGVDEEWRR